MNRLDKLPHIVDEQLTHVRMSDSLKERVRRGIALEQGQKAPRPFYARPRLMAGALALCACLVLLLIYAPFGPAPGDETTLPAVTGPVTGPVTLLGNITVTAQSEARGGVAVDTAFVIETGESALTAETLKGGLTVTPHIDYNLTAQGEGQFLLTPLSTLEMGTVYQIAMTGLVSPQTEAPGALSWAFQTESALRLVSSLPADGSDWAGVDTGIEMTFSRPVSDAQGLITIVPETPGRLEYYDHTVVFVPQGGLTPDTLYTVTLSPDLEAATGESLGESVSFAFRSGTSNGGTPKFYLSGALTESFLPQDPVVVSLYSYNYWESDEIPVTVTLYSLSGQDYSRLADAHAGALHPRLGRSADHVLDTTGLEPLYTYSDAIVHASYRYYVVLPENPGAGYYLIDIRPTDENTLGNTAIQKLVCVSDLSVYVQSLNGQALVWVNDAATGLPLNNAAVSITLPAGDTQAFARRSTGSDGTALLDISGTETDTLPISVTAPDGREWRDRVSMLTQVQRPAYDVYQACLYFDRAAYLPTDTIHFWGVVRARDGSAQLPPSVRLAFGTLPEQTLSLDEHGMFRGSVSYENLISTWMHVRLLMGDDSLVSSGIQVMEYTKPAYILQLKADKPYYRKGERATITATATFFDATPATGLNLRVGDTDGVTDAQGQLLHRQSFEAYSGSDWRPGGRYISAQTTGQEDANVWQSIQPTYFPSDYMQRLELVEADGGWQLAAATHEIDFDAVDSWLAQHPDTFYGQDFDAAIQGAPYSQSFTAEVVQTLWTRRVTGERYDFIHKKVVETYTYDSANTTVDTFTLSSVDGQGLSALLAYESDPLCYYTLRMNWTTPDGVVMSSSLSLGDYWFYGWDRGIKDYYLTSENRLFTENGTLTATLIERNGAMDMAGRLLYTVSQRDMLYWEQTTGDTFDIDCDAAHIPGFTVTAAYFDGRHIFPVSALWCYYDEQERALDIEITPDKPSYAPGDTATVTVQLRGAAGAPVEGSFVLSVVDEAAFAVQEQYIDLLDQMYYLYYRAPSAFASYVQHSLDDGAFAEEGGEGDAEGFRQDFLDTAAFLTGRTGPDGTATLTFQLADNLTAWRLTCAAVTADGWAGLSRRNVAATLPFFVNVVRSTQYVAGDTVVLSARGAGVSVSQADRVAYQASITGAGLADTLSTTVAAGDYAYFNFGKLPVGQYDVELTALCGTLRDAVRYTVDVIDSRLEVPVTTVTDIAGLSALESARYPVTLTFFDPGLTGYLTGALDLSGLYGQRGDQRLARAAADFLLESLGLDTAAQTDLSGAQLWDGGVALYSYAQSDPGLTAYALAACPQLIDVDAAKAYLYTVLYNRASAQEDVARAYLGLAACGEPVLHDLRAQLGAREDLSWNLPLALGLSLLGDQTAARQWYETAVAPLLQPYGDSAAYLDAPADAAGDVTYTRADLTAQAAALAAGVGHTDSAKLIRYLRQTGTLAGNPLPVLLALTVQPAPAVTGETVLTFTVDGSPVRVTLTPEKPLYTVRLHEKQLGEAGFAVQSGQAAVAVSWVGGADALRTPLPQDRFTVDKAYETLPDGRVAVRIAVGVNTRLSTATDSLYEGYYTLTDVLPSGLRFVSVPYVYNGGWYLSHEENGRLSFSLDTRVWNGGQITHRQSFIITYYARPALPGVFVAESAVLQHPTSGGSMSTARGVYTTP